MTLDDRPPGPDEIGVPELTETLERIEKIRDLLPVQTSTLLIMHTLLTVVLAGLFGRLSLAQTRRANAALERVEHELDARIPKRRR